MWNEVCNTVASGDYWKVLVVLALVGAAIAIVAYKLGRASGEMDAAEHFIYGEREAVPEIILWRDGVMVGFCTKQGERYTVGVLDEDNTSRVMLDSTEDDPILYITVDGDAATVGHVETP